MTPRTEPQFVNNLTAYRLGEICRKAADDPNCGDYIDRGLILVRLLNEAGFKVEELRDDNPSR